jgi:hypothetical protein
MLPAYESSTIQNGGIHNKLPLIVVKWSLIMGGSL